MAEIYGSFGRVITGNTLGGSIGSLARQILQDKITRIFNAYRDEVAFEGAVLDAASAISRLQALLAMVDPNSPAAQDINEYIDAIRQEDRSRRVNKAINTLATQDFATRDYGALIKTLQGIQSDPTITESEREALKAQIATQVRNLIDNAMNQYANGGSVTLDGKKIDLTLGGGGAQLLSTIQGLMTQFPDMQSEIGQKYDIAQSQVIVKEAEFAYTSLDTTKDSVKMKATEDLLTAYQKAYEVLKNSKYDLSQSQEALQMQKNIQDTKENLDVLQKNAAIKYAQSYLDKGTTKAAAYFDAIDTYAKGALGTARTTYMGTDGTLFGAVMGADINTIYQYLDAIAAENGGKTTLTIDGKTYDISHDGFKNAVVNSSGIMNDLFKFANNNDSVSKQWQTDLKGMNESISALIKNKEIFSIEDKYDSLRGDLERAVIASGGDVFKIQAAYVEYGKQMNKLAATYNNSMFADNLRAEAYYAINGMEDKTNKAKFYSEFSGNIWGDAFDASKLAVAAAHQAAINTSKSRLETYIGLDGSKITGINGQDSVMTEFGRVDMPKWVDAGIRLKNPLGGNDVVYQTLSLKNDVGRDMGFVAVVNGKFVGAKLLYSKKYQFFKAEELNKYFGDRGITIDNFLDKITISGGSGWLAISGLTDGSIGTSGDDYSLSDLRSGNVNIPTGSESGVSTSLTPEEKKTAIDQVLSNYKIESDFVFERQAPGADPLKGFYIVIDGEKYLAENILGRDTAYEAYMRKVTYVAPGAGEDATKSGVPGLGGGPGNTFARGIPQGTQSPLAGGAATAGMNPDEIAYMQRLNVSRETSTAASRKPTAAQTVQSLVDFRAGERAAGVSPAAKTATPLAPAVGTPLATKPLVSTGVPFKPAALTPKSVAGDSLAERLAQMRRQQAAASSAQTSIGGFFRNSPFKIGL